MKLKNFLSKNINSRKLIVIGASIIILLGVSFLLFKTNFNFNNNDVYFAFYNGKEKLNAMPLKDNSEDLIFSRGECDNGATIIWHEEEWAPLVKNLSKSKTKCSLYFRKKESIELCDKYGSDSILCYISKLSETDKVNLAYDGKEVLGEKLGTKDNNLRYIGVGPNNYIKFNNELWRVLGIMNNIIEVSEDDSKVENMGSYLKIVKNDSLGNYSWDSSAPDINNGKGVNEWSESDIQKVLNNDYLYKENRGGICYSGINNNVKECPVWDNVGIDNSVRGMIANIKWNTGTIPLEWTSSITFPYYLYDYERSKNNGKDFCVKSGNSNLCNDTTNRTTEWVGKIGLMYPSDYGYASGGNIRNNCLNSEMYLYDKNGCNDNIWILLNKYEWSITPNVAANSGGLVMGFARDGLFSQYNAFNAYEIRPVVYLKSSVKISSNPNPELEYGSIDNPFILIQN